MNVETLVEIFLYSFFSFYFGCSVLLYIKYEVIAPRVHDMLVNKIFS